MKKIVALLLAMAMILALAACGAKTEAPAAAEKTETNEQTNTNEKTDEQTVFVNLMIFSSHLKFSDINIVLPSSSDAGGVSFSLS